MSYCFISHLIIYKMIYFGIQENYLIRAATLLQFAKESSTAKVKLE